MSDNVMVRVVILYQSGEARQVTVAKWSRQGYDGKN